MKKIGIIGTGDVGTSLTRGLLGKGYEVMVGSRDGTKAAALDLALKQDVKTGTFTEVAAWGELVILAVKGGAAEGVAGELAGLFAGKTVIDVTNPIADSAPENGVMHFFTTLEHSLGELVQEAAPAAKVVKAWNSVGHAHMIDPSFGEKPSMPLCGNDAEARKEVAELLRACGWEPEDMGSIISARAIEPLCMLWCIPGFQNNDWSHAFRIVR